MLLINNLTKCVYILIIIDYRRQTDTINDKVLCPWVILCVTGDFKLKFHTFDPTTYLSVIRTRVLTLSCIKFYPLKINHGKRHAFQIIFR